MMRLSVLVAAALGLGAHEALASGYPVPPGHPFRDAAYAPELVVIPSGAFLMGSTDAETTSEKRAPATAAAEHPLHRVTLPTPLAVGQAPVTVEEFSRFAAAANFTSKGCVVLQAGKWGPDTSRSFRDPAFAQGPRNPVTCVDVADANAYAAWLSARSGHRYRLLHEAEYEYATRAGTTTARPWGGTRADLCAHANGADQSFNRLEPGDGSVNLSCDDGYAFTSPVGHFPANRFGLFDTIGNVWEWTDDCQTPDYAHAPAAASDTPSGGDCSRHVIRGGSWHNHPDALRAASRYSLPVTMRSSSLGFRVARLPD